MLVLLTAHATPSAVPLLVELVVAALVVVVLLARRPVARLARAATARLAQRRSTERLSPAPSVSGDGDAR
jgi:hypothetical protein